MWNACIVLFFRESFVCVAGLPLVSLAGALSPVCRQWRANAQRTRFQTSSSDVPLAKKDHNVTVDEDGRLHVLGANRSAAGQEISNEHELRVRLFSEHPQKEAERVLSTFGGNPASVSKQVLV